ncbi:MAG TPA: choice-of-anchor E domain-containing protein, partial [Verrucomicrobiota bacterium]|nr:choice-of-anchor E domain-containing protein [Verrucomicrobiota bacterium]
MTRSIRFWKSALVVWSFAAWMVTGSAARYSSSSRTFTLGPGETAFGIEVSQFDPTIHSGPLTQVHVRIEATWEGRLEFSGEGPTRMVTYELGEAVILVQGVTAGLVVPAPLKLKLNGTQEVAAGATLTIVSQTSGAQQAVVIDGPMIAPYQGSGTVAYDFDFSALYLPLLSTSPISVVGLACDSRITGRIIVEYFDGAPPLARDDALGIVVGPTVAWSIQTFLANDTSGSEGELEFLDVSTHSAQGAALEVVGGQVVYHAVAGFSGPDS